MSKMILQAVQYVRRQPKDADPPITVSVSPDNVVMKKDDSKRQTYSFDVRVYNGTEPVPYGTDGSEGFVCGFLNGSRDALIADTLAWSFSVATDNSYFTYKLSLQAGKTAAIDISFDVTVTIGGKKTVLTQKVHATTVEDGAKGEQGIEGCIVRTSEWTTGVEYHNDKDLTTWPRYLDVVAVRGSSGTVDCYQCVATHTSSLLNTPAFEGNAKYWQKVNDMKPIYTSLLIAENAVLRFGQTNRLLIMDTEGKKVQGCLQGVEDETNGYPLWIGGITAGASNFKVKYGGQLEASEAIITGTINATSGKIAGFTIDGTSLTNTPWTNDATIIFRNDNKNCFAGIGGNVLPSSSGNRAVARFENEDASDQWGLGRNIAAIFSAKNGAYNFAFTGNGNGILNGWLSGYKYSRYSLVKGNTIYSGYAQITENNVWFICSNVDGSGITLPTLDDVRGALGIGTSTNFAVQYTIIAEPGTKNFAVYGRNKRENSSKETPWNTEDLPLILNCNANNVDYETLGPGNIETFLLTYNPTMENKVNDYTTKYTARITGHEY